MSLIAAAIVVLGVANNALFVQAPHITETISDSLLSTAQKVETFAYNFSTRTTAAVTDATQNIKLLLDRTEPQEIVIGFEDDSYEEIYTPQIARVESTSAEVFEQNNFPPQTEPLYGAQIYTPENTYTTINSKDIEQRLLIQKNYFSKQIDRIYDRVKNNTQELNDRVDSVTTTSSGISFATIALGGTGISTVPSYGQLLMGDGSGGYTLIATSSLGISGGGGSSQWTTNGSDIYYTTGSVGIGTTTPSTGIAGKLVVEQTHDAQTAVRILNLSDTPNAYAELAVRAGNVTTYIGSTPQNSSVTSGAGSAGRGYIWSQSTGANRGLDLIAASPSSDLRFFTGGYGASSERMRITSTGDVGIGTTTPQYGLHIYESIGSASQNIQTADAAGEAAINLENSVRRWKIKATNASGDAFVIRDQTAGQDRFVIGNTGNIGIGSTSPYAKLSVAGTSIASTTLALRPIASQTANVLDVYNSSGSLSTVITAAGNVGIGTTSPGSALSVVSPGLSVFDIVSITGSLRNEGGSGLKIAPTIQAVTSVKNSMSALNVSPIFTDNISGTDVVDFASIRSTAMTGGIAGAMTNTYGLYVEPNTQGTNNYGAYIGGNVGIGTTTPGANFDVNGTTRLGGSNVSVYPALTLNNKSADAAGVGTGLQFKNRNDASNYMGGIQTIYRGGITSTLTMMDFFAGGDSATPKMTLSGGGNLGIGTTSPFTTLSVVGDGWFENGSTKITVKNSANSVKTEYASNSIQSYNSNLFINAAGNNVIFSASSNIGIGTTTPASILHLDSGTASLPSISLSASGGSLQTIGRASASFTGAATTDLGIRFSNKLWLGNTGTASAVLDSSGNFGIGTTTPAGNLEVLGSTGIYSRNSSGGRIVFDDSDVASASTPMAYITGADGSLQFGRANRAASGLTTGSAESLRITSTGNVGIGTTTPSVKLETYTTGTFSLAASSNNGSLWFGHDATTNFIQSVATNRTSAQNLYIGGYATQAPALTEIEGASIFLNGNVGIGTTSPASLLQLSGNGGVPQLIISGTAAGQNMKDWRFVADSTSLFLGTLNESTTATGDYAIRLGRETNSNDVDYIEFATNNEANKMRFTNSGNLGIGTTSPTSKLGFGNGLGDKIALWEDGSIKYGFGIQASLMQIYTNSSSADISFGYGDSSNFTRNVTFKGAGLAGFGTTTPGARLHTVGIDGGSYPFAISGNTKGLRAITSSTAVTLQGVDTTLAGSYQPLAFGGSELIFQSNGATEGMRLTSTSRLGIGTSTPTSRLSVVHNGASATPVAFIGDNGSPGSITDGATFRVANDGTGNRFAVAEFSSGASNMVFTNAGNLGIGTTTPNVRLHAAMSNGAFPALASDTGIVVSNTSVAGGSAAMSIIAGVSGFSTLNFGDTADENVGYIQYGHANNYLSFGANTNEYMRMTSGGDIGVGSTTPFSKFSIENLGSGNSFMVSDQLLDSSPFVIDNAGNVGIGTTTPTALLSLGNGSGSPGTTPALGINFGDSTANLYRLASGMIRTDGALAVGGNLHVYFGNHMFINKAGNGWLNFAARDTTGAEAVFNLSNIGTLTTSGNVGIGTSTPGVARTVIEGNSNILSVLGLSNSSNTANSRTLLNFYDNTAENAAAIGSAREASGTDWGLIFRTGSGNSSSGPSDRLYISAAGNVGIGTTSPSTLLELAASAPTITLASTNSLISGGAAYGDIDFTSNDPSGAGNMARIRAKGVDNNFGGDSDLTFWTKQGGGSMAEKMRLTSVGTLNIGTTTTSAFLVVENITTRDSFIVTDQALDSTPFIINNAGNVGIGTTSPTYKLEVAGDVGATSFINMSSRSVKKDITYVPFEQTQQTLDKIKALKFATYRYVTENDSEPLHLGLIAEESPEDILAPGGRGIDVYKLATFALQGIQSLIARIEKLEAALANVSTGFTDIFKAKTVEVEQGITIKDSKTGEYYCIVVENGSMKNIPGKCGSTPAPEANDSDDESDDSSDGSDDSSNSTDSSDSSSSSDNQDSQNTATDEEQDTVDDSSEGGDTENDDTTNVDTTGDASETESLDNSTETENNDTVNPSEESSDSSTDSSSETVSDPSDSESTSSETSDSSSSESTDSPSGSESSPSDSSDSSGSTESSSSSESSSSTDGGSSDTQ